LLWSFLVFLPQRRSWPLHNLIIWTGFSVLIQEVVERELEYRLLVPLLVHLPFASFRTSRLDHLRSSVLRQGGLTGSPGDLNVPGDQTGSGNGLTAMLCHLLGSTVAV
jgi:hypothetical protein